MSEPMHRAQILLEPRQRQKLGEIARRQGRSISAVARDAIDAGLKILEGENEVWERRAHVLADLRALREKQPFVYEGDLIGEARQEREDEMDEIWRSGT